jgi:hypothetical protein
MAKIISSSVRNRGPKLILQFKDQPGYIQLGVGLASLHTETAIALKAQAYPWI